MVDMAVLIDKAMMNTKQTQCQGSHLLYREYDLQSATQFQRLSIVIHRQFLHRSRCRSSQSICVLQVPWQWYLQVS